MRLMLCSGIGLVIVIAACKAPTGPSGVQHISWVADPSDSAGIHAPDTVKVGTVFAASFSTAEGGCRAFDHLAYRSGESSVTITPYDRSLAVAGEACPPYLRFFTQTAEARFTRTGADTLNVYAYLDNGLAYPQLGTIQKVIQVIP
ncbi:MAG TPA: hypothetical protein VJN62_09215 [Gemmatimonadales bacterium]|nr:hypothetical protein [Gemmatimonadales bacterium]